MSFGRKSAFAAAALAGLMVASAAHAADENMSTCLIKASQVRSAIAAAQPGQTKDEAAAQAKVGRDFCSAAYFTKGVAHYTKALELLGKS
jgi:hypothetical protein